MRRVALVETVSAELHRHHGAEFFPFVLGWLRARGATAEWWAFGARARGAREEVRGAVDLAGDARGLLAEHLARLAPDAVLFHSRPAPRLAEAVAAAAPSARVVDLTRAPLRASATLAELARLLDRDDGAPDGAALVLDAVSPCFERRILDGADTCAAQAARLAGEIACAYRPLVREAAPYRDLAAAGEHRGCAFCDRGAPPSPAARRPRTSPRELALRQIEAHQRDRASEGAPFAYLVDDGRLAADVGGLLEAVIERGLRPCTLHVMPRIDEVLAQRERLRRVLPRAAAAGHRVGLLSTGVENFSPDENERLNKGISPAQVWACLDLLRELETAAPGTFFVEPGVFAGILFTPWTRPADLRANLEAARRLGRGWLERVMGTRLQLFPDTPIAALARRDRLVADRLGSAGDVDAVCLSSPDATELPWRFADRRTELAHAILVRLDPIAFSARVAGDPLTAELRALRAGLPGALAGDYVELSAAIVDAVEALGATATPAEIFREIAASPAALAARQVPAPPPRAPAPRARPAPPGEDLRITFADPASGVARCVFRVGRASPGEPAFRVIGTTRVTYDRGPAGGALHACAAVVVAVAREIGAPPSPADLARWQHLLRERLGRSPAAGALRVDCALPSPT